MPAPQFRYWLLTIPQNAFLPYLPPTVSWIRGQLECGHETEYIHWQILCCFHNKCTLRAVKQLFGDGIHAEPAKARAARDYVWKEDTRIPSKCLLTLT